MRGALCVVVVLGGGCVTSMSTPQTDDPGDPAATALVTDANGCNGTATLATTRGNQTSTQFGPFVFGHGRFCLHVDATRLDRAHLMAGTDSFAGVASPIAVGMETPDGTPLVEGWDVAIGVTDPRASAHLEMEIVAGTTTDLVFVVDGTATGSRVFVGLMDPLE